jgi:hypothetical protein
VAVAHFFLVRRYYVHITSEANKLCVPRHVFARYRLAARSSHRSIHLLRFLPRRFDCARVGTSTFHFRSCSASDRVCALDAAVSSSLVPQPLRVFLSSVGRDRCFFRCLNLCKLSVCWGATSADAPLLCSTRACLCRRFCSLCDLCFSTSRTKRLTRRWSERRTAVRSTFEMTSILPPQATRAFVRRRSSCSR